LTAANEAGQLFVIRGALELLVENTESLLTQNSRGTDGAVFGVSGAAEHTEKFLFATREGWALAKGVGWVD
jgi:hypothetical protein